MNECKHHQRNYDTATIANVVIPVWACRECGYRDTLPDECKLDNVKIEGHRGRWYSLGYKWHVINGELIEVHLYEHERYGEEAPHVIATADGKVLLENVYNGWWDWREYVLYEQGYRDYNHNLIINEPISI